MCLAGRRDGPTEDCGGVYAYELICAVSDPGNPDHAAAMAEFSHVYGEFAADPEAVRATPFDIGEINKTMAGLGWQDQDERDGSDAGQQRNYPAPLAELVGAVRAEAGKRELRQLIGKARLDQPVLVDTATASQMVRPYNWLLNRVGDDGIKLTAAGDLPPAHVEAAMTELGLGEEWIGKGNRENQTLPVLHLRESAAAMGLLRKRHGRSCSAHLHANCAATRSRCGGTWPSGYHPRHGTPAKPRPGSFSCSHWPPRPPTTQT